MSRVRSAAGLVAGTVAAALLAAGCGGQQAESPAHTLAASACHASGAKAADLAARAAAADSRYATLAADERASAVSQSQQRGELSDGSGADDGLDALTQTQADDSVVGQKVLADCVSLGLPVVRR